MMNLKFPHNPPNNYYYEFVPFKSDYVSIWISCSGVFTYNSGGKSSSIWGFYNTKTDTYYSPVTPTQLGNKVEIGRTTPYSAMIRNLNPLEAAFL